MIQWLMAIALRERVVVIAAAALLLFAGLYSFSQLDIEAYPDPVQPMTEILTLPTGFSAEEVERLVTVPTEYGMSGMLHLASMESISLYGLSDIRLYFDWGSDYEFDRTQTINQLTFVTLPQGIQPGLSPENPIGEIYRYTVQSPDHDLVKEKDAEDWICEKQLKTVPGVLDVRASADSLRSTTSISTRRSSPIMPSRYRRSWLRFRTPIPTRAAVISTSGNRPSMCAASA